MAGSTCCLSRTGIRHPTGFLLVLLVICASAWTTIAKECFSCEVAALDCDPDLNICTSDCNTKEKCKSETDWCLISVVQNKNDSSIFDSAYFACFDNSNPARTVDTNLCEVFEEELDYGSSSLGVTYSCMCTLDSCNSAIYFPRSYTDFPEGEKNNTKEGEKNNTKEVEKNNTKESEKNKTDAVTQPPTRTKRVDTQPVQEFGPDNGHQVTRATTGEEIAIIVLASVIPALIMSIVFFLIGYVYVTRCRSHKTCFDSKDHIPTSHTESTSLDLTQDSVLKIMGDGDDDNPSDTQINLATNCLPLNLDTVIGRGRFSSVWKAHHKHGDGTTSLAVKVFQERDSQSWFVEKELFTDESVTLHHDNVIEYIAAEARRVGHQQDVRQFWLVTKYYPKGSLQDYLATRATTWPELCRMSGSVARGLSHLHADVYGSHGLHKIPVAHRDLKSSNVLVKDDGECVIADFGLAVKLDPQVSIDVLANSGQVGTPRYMAPEALESKVNLQDTESFKQMDVYSLALVIWEIASRCTLNRDMKEYYLPYDDIITGHPTVEEMKTHVVQRGRRPTIPESWSQSTGMELVASTMRECWDADPEGRLTAPCVENRFADMMTWVEGEQHLGHRDTHSVTVV